MDGIYRTFQLHLPTGYTGTTDIPLVIAMHGGTGTGPQMALQSLLNPKSNAEDFVVVYPEGIPNTSGGLRTWNAGWCCGYAVTQNVDDVAFISALIDSLNLLYAIDLNRVYATGMSNGGFMSYRLGCELSERIAAIAPVACSMGMNDCFPAVAVPVIAFNSFLDTNVPVNGGVGSGLSDHWNSPQDSVMAVWSNYNGCDPTADTLQNDSEFLHLKWSNCNCGYTNEQYITQDGGHSWPGGIAFGDPVSAYIDATDLMWDFFLQYDLSCPLSVEENENEVLIYPNPT
ncbi:MAG: phospholipase [Crocinitomicaceae bacterium]|nr:phospholipase [Crocinitomicaceae bacterium]